MDRTEQLKYCKICKHQDFDFNQGIICKFTRQQADFENSCNSFEKDIEKENAAIKDYTYTRKNAYRANGGRRFINYIIDRIMIFAFSFLFGGMLGIIFTIFSPSSMRIFEGDTRLIDYGIGILLSLIYYTILEDATGRTVGKFVTGTRVVDVKGNRPGFGKILIRTICRFIPFEAFSFLGPEASGWHDKISGTMVIMNDKHKKVSEASDAQFIN